MPFEPYIIPEGDVVNVGGVLWTNNGAGNGMVFPSVTITFSEAPATYTLVSDTPQTAAGRDIVLQGLGTGGWFDMWRGTEDDLPAEVNLLGLTFTEVRAQYTLANGCIYYATGTIAVPPCGTIDAEVTNIADCGENSFHLEVNIISTDTFSLGNIIAVVNGVQQLPGAQAIIGNNILPSYGITDTVSFVVVNTFDPACNYESDDYTHPQLPAMDTFVLLAVDASYQASAIPGEAYLIVSNTTGAGNLWASHVDEIWSGTAFVVPADQSIIFATGATGISGYWQMDSGTAVQVFPPSASVFNTITEVYTTSLAPIAPFIAGISIAITYECPSVPQETLYVGLIEDYTPQTFSSLCALDAITINLVYFTGCPVIVPGVITTYTPTGDPDPDFSTGGLNNFVIDAVLDEDNNIILGGNFTAYGATPVGYFTRLNPDGSLDTAFNTAMGTGFNNLVRAVVIDSQGRYLVCGDFTAHNGTPVGRLARINTDGTLDTTFNTAIGTGFNFRVFSIIEFNEDDEFLISGEFSTFNGVAALRIIKLDINGAKVVSFVGAVSSTPGGMWLDPSNGTVIMASGFAIFYNGISIRFGGAVNSIFRIDATTGALLGVVAQGTQFDGSVTWVSVQSDGAIIVNGVFATYNGVTVNRIVRMNGVGAIDLTFKGNTGTGFSADTTTSTIMPNGQIAIGVIDPTSTFNGLVTKGLVLLNTDGSRDMAFNAGTGYTGGRVTAMYPTTTGGLITVGGLTALNGTSRLRVAKII